MRHSIAAAAVAGSVLAGAGFGLAYLGPSAATAQTPSSSSSSSSDQATPPAVEQHPWLAVAAQTIGISEDDLIAAVQSGQTIAQVAQAHGVDPQAVIDAMVADAESHLSENVADFVNNTPQDLSRHRHPGQPPGPSLDVAASAIGVTVDDLRTALQSGQTIAEVAQAHGVDPQTVVDALVADAQQHLDQAVAAGRLSQERADDIASHLSDQMTKLVNNLPPAGPDGSGFGPGFGGPGFGGPGDLGSGSSS